MSQKKNPDSTFRNDGCDEYTVEKFIRQEMERDEYQKGEGTTDIEAIRLWNSYSDEAKVMWLHNAFCGNCDKCGGRIARCCD